MTAAQFIDRMPDRFVEIPLHRVGPQEGDIQIRAAEKRPQHPGKLRTEDAVPRQPGEQGDGGGTAVRSPRGKQAVEVHVRGDPGETDQESVGHQIRRVGHAGVHGLGRRCIPREEKRDRRQ